MRAYRPSYYAEYEDDEERDEQALLDVRIANVRFYARRAASGLPLFDKATAAPQGRQARKSASPGAGQQPGTTMTSHYVGSS